MRLLPPLPISLVALAAVLSTLPANAADYSISGVATTTNGGATLANGDSITVEQSGSLNVSGGDGLAGSGDNIQTNVLGDISVTGPNAYGVAIIGNNSATTVSGRITTSDYVTGVMHWGDNTSLNLSGNISTSGPEAYGLGVSGNNNQTTVTGNITTSGLQARGVGIEGDGNITSISGAITATGGSSQGILQFGNNNQLNLSGDVSVSGNDSLGVANITENGVTTISGNISASGLNSYGLVDLAIGNVTTISGRITYSGDAGAALMTAGDSNIYEISGSLIATGSNPTAIALGADSNSNTYKFNKGVRIIGLIAQDGAGSNNYLKFNVGSAMSYVYATAGSWSLQDLDGRPVVAGSAMAAGIGNAETADELQFDRLSSLNHSLLDRSDQFDHSVGQRNAWADTYYRHSARRQSVVDPTAVDYKNDGYGVNVGLPGASVHGVPFDLVLGLQKSSLDVNDQTQKINATSIRGGVFFPDLYVKGDVSLSAKALLGYNSYDGVRKVLVNTNTTTGITEYNSKYNSWETTMGVDARYRRLVGGSTTLLAGAGVDLISEMIGPYTETANFKWEKRTLTQSVARMSLGINHTLTNGLTTYLTGSLQRRNVLAGKTTNYSIEGNPVSFSGGVMSDSLRQINLGAKLKANDRMQVVFNLQTATSENNVRGYGAFIGVKGQF